jgi:hypothetical protein
MKATKKSLALWRPIVLPRNFGSRQFAFSSFAIEFSRGPATKMFCSFNRNLAVWTAFQNLTEIFDREQNVNAFPAKCFWHEMLDRKRSHWADSSSNSWAVARGSVLFDLSNRNPVAPIGFKTFTYIFASVKCQSVLSRLSPPFCIAITACGTLLGLAAMECPFARWIPEPRDEQKACKLHQSPDHLPGGVMSSAKASAIGSSAISGLSCRQIGRRCR